MSGVGGEGREGACPSQPVSSLRQMTSGPSLYASASRVPYYQPLPHLHQLCDCAIRHRHSFALLWTALVSDNACFSHGDVSIVQHDTPPLQDHVSLASKPRRLPINQRFNSFQQDRDETDAQIIRVYLHYFDHHVLVTAKTLSILSVATHPQKYYQDRSMQYLSIYSYSFESAYATRILVMSRNSAFGGQCYTLEHTWVTRIHSSTLEPTLWNENASARLYR